LSVGNRKRDTLCSVMTPSRSFRFGTVSLLHPFQTQRARNKQYFREIFFIGKYKYGVGNCPFYVDPCHYSVVRSLAAEGRRISRHGGELGINGKRSRGQPARGALQLGFWVRC